MLIDEKTAEERLNSPNNLAEKFGVVHKVWNNKGNTGPRGIPQFMKDSIGILTRSGAMTETEAAKEFGVAPSTSHNYKEGKLGADKEAIEQGLVRVRDKAMDRLMTSLGFITDDKLEKCQAPALSKVASDMSKVIQNTLPKDQQTPQIQLTIYTPEIRSEERYPVLEVNK